MIVTLSGGPYDGREVDLADPAPTIDASHPTDLYVRSADPAIYVWTEGARPQPTPDEPTWRDALPAGVADHLVHLRDFRDAVRAGTAVTNAQTVHVIADLIDALRLLVDDRLP